jgi:hypothetical protein
VGTAAGALISTVGNATRALRVLSSLALLALIACDGDLSRPSLYSQVEVSVTAGGEPVPGAQLILYTGPRRIGYGTTGADGRYTFRRVPANGYSLALLPVPAGYDTISRGPNQQPANIFGGFDIGGVSTANGFVPGQPVTLEVPITLVKR